MCPPLEATRTSVKSLSSSAISTYKFIPTEKSARYSHVTTHCSLNKPELEQRKSSQCAVQCSTQNTKITLWGWTRYCSRFILPAVSFLVLGLRCSLETDRQKAHQHFLQCDQDGMPFSTSKTVPPTTRNNASLI